MSLDTYAGLKASISAYLDRDDLTDEIDDFIDLAEARHKNDVRFRDMLTRGSLTISDRFTDLPDGYLEAKNLRLLTSPVAPLEYVSQDVMDIKRRDDTGQPAYFTIHSQIEVDTTPDTSYSAEMVYYKAVDPLSGSNTSNIILARSPGLYLFGALSEAAAFLEYAELATGFNEKYEQALEQLRMADIKTRSVGMRKMFIIGATP